MDNKQQNILSRLVIDGLDVRDKLNDLFNDIQNGDKDVKNLREELQSISFRLDASLENYDRHLQALEDASTLIPKMKIRKALRTAQRLRMSNNILSTLQ